MSKDNLDKNLEIDFEIHDSNPFERTKPWNRFGVSPIPLLKFESSNYNLTKDEILRASLRPKELVLEDNYVYVKTGERAFVKGGRNLLKLDYLRSNNTLD